MNTVAARLARPLSNPEGFLFAIALGLPAAAFLLLPGFLVSSDGYYHLYRIVALDAALQDGQWPVRWAQDLYFGYGYPLFNYYAPLAYWLGEAFHRGGLSFVNAYKAVSLAGVLLGATGAYVMARRLVRPFTAVLASVLYVYAPFPLTDLYFRADLPEYLALGLLPWAFWAVMRGVESWRAVAPAGVLLGVLILTHNGLAFVAAPFLGLFALWYALTPAAGPASVVPRVHPRLQNSLKEFRFLRATGWVVPRLLRVGLLGLAALGLAATFWLPALAERGFVQFDRLLLIDYREQFVGLTDLLSTDLVQRYVAVAVGTWHVFPYRVGLIQTLAVLAGVGLLVAGAVAGKKRLAGERLGLVFAVICAVALLLTQSVTRPLWDAIPLLAHLQFPWRLLSLIALPAALLGALAIDRIRSPIPRRAATLALVALTFWSTLGGLRPVSSDLGNQVATTAGSQWFETLYNTIGTTTRGEFLPVAVREPAATSAAVLDSNVGDSPAVPDVRIEPPAAGTATAAWQRGRLVVDATLSGDAVVRLPVAAFPAWQVAVNDSFLEWQPTTPDGLIGVRLAPGRHRLEAFFEETAIERLSNVVSLGSLVVLAGLGIAGSRRPLTRRLRRLGGNRSRRGIAVARAGAVFALAVVATIGLGRLARAPASVPPGEVRGELAGGQLTFGARLGPARGASGLRPVLPAEPLEVHLQFAGPAALVPRTISARLTNAAGETWSKLEGLEADGLSRTAKLTIAPDAPPGIYRVEVGLLEQAEPPEHAEIGRFWQASLLPIQNRIQLGPVAVLAGEPQPASAASVVSFVGGLRLNAVSLGPDAALPPLVPRLPGAPVPAVAGDDLLVRLQWQAAEPIPDDLRFSLHLLDQSRLLWAVRESQPVAGLAPTSLWLPGRPVGDLLRLHVPADTPPGDYALQLRALRANGAALSTLDAAGQPSLPQVPLATVRVEPRPDFGLPVETRVRPIGPGLGFVDGSASGSYRPGDRIEITARFAGLLGAQDQTITLALEDASGAIVRVGVPPAGEGYPVGRWRPGELLRGRHLLRVPVSAAPGQYTVTLTGASGERVRLGSVTVEPAPPRREAAPPAQRVDVSFGDVAVLLGVDLPASAARGAELPVRLVWRAARDGTEAYAVSVQLLDETNRLVAQQDGAPANGSAPTNQWREDETIDDPRALRLPADLAPGPYRLIAILYDQATNRRVATPSGDFATLGTIEVR